VVHLDLGRGLDVRDVVREGDEVHHLLLDLLDQVVERGRVVLALRVRKLRASLEISKASARTTHTPSVKRTFMSDSMRKPSEMKR
jgi:hypothetical protein